MKDINKKKKSKLCLLYIHIFIFDLLFHIYNS